MLHKCDLSGAYRLPPVDPDAVAAFWKLCRILYHWGLVESPSKACEPSICMVCSGHHDWYKSNGPGCLSRQTAWAFHAAAGLCGEGLCHQKTDTKPGGCLTMLCDNLRSVVVIQTVKDRDPFLQAYLQELFFLQARWECQVRTQQIRSVDNRLPDLGPFSISLPKLSQLKAKSWSQPSNLIQTGFLSCVQVSDLSEILTWDSS